jgi:omega-amidase
MSSDTFSNEKFKIGLCQTAVSADKAVSLANARASVEEAVTQGAQLVVLGEMFSCPYATKFFREYGERLPSSGKAADDSCPTVKLLAELATKHGIWLIGGSLPELEGDKVYNTCLVVSPAGEIVAKHRKVHLFDIDVPAKDDKPAIKFKESDVLSGGDDLTIVDLPWCRVGLGICYDVRFPEHALCLRQRGAKLLVYPGAFNMNTGPVHWSLLGQARAVDAQCFMAMVSPARSEDPKDYQAWGHSLLVSPWAKVLVEAEHAPGVFVHEVDPAEADRIRAQVPTTMQKRSDLYLPYADERATKQAKI